MPTPRIFDGSQIGELASRFSRSILPPFHPVSAAIAFALVLACASCGRPSTESKKPESLTDAPTSSSSKKDSRKKPHTVEGDATWYAVPVNSLAHRRAAKGELTAAHNHLPMGSVVRVTHMGNGKSVIVRITDRGITKRGTIIDLCKPAAEDLGMLSEGVARVRIEELPDDSGTDAPPDSQATSANP